MFPKSLRPLLPYLKKYRRSYWWGGIFVLFMNAAWVLVPPIVGRAIDDMREAGISLHKIGIVALVLLLGTWALVINGTFFAAMSIRTRNRELMLPLLLLPVSIPAVTGMVSATTAVLTGESSPMTHIKLLAAYCVVFTAASFALFEMVLNAE